MKFAVVLHKDKHSTYGVTVPDVPGCFSAGDTIEQALDNVREAIYAHLELLAEEGEPIPEDTEIDMERLISDKDYAGGIFALVEVDTDDLKGPAERINLTVQKRALTKIDNAARLLNDSRSALMTRATLQFIASGRTVARASSTGRLIGKSAPKSRRAAVQARKRKSVR